MILSEEDYKKVMDTMPVVCVDGLVMNDKNEFLLVKRLNEPLKGEFWMPGGRLHKGERAEAAIKRKMKEELGIEVEIVKSLGFFEEFFDRTEQNNSNGFHAIALVYLLRPLGSTIRLDEQSGEWRWFSELPPRISEYGLLEAISK